MSQDLDLEESLARVPLRRATLRRLGAYFRPLGRPIVLALVLEGIWVASMILDPALVRWVLDGPLARGDLAGCLPVLLLLGANIVARGLLTVWELRLSTAVGVEVIDRVRRDLFGHVQRLSMRYFDRTRHGRIIARVDRDVDHLEHLVFWGPIVLTSLVLSLVISLITLLVINARLALWLLLAVPVVALLTAVFQRLGLPAYRKVRERQAAISTHVAESIQGVRVIQAFVAQDRERGELLARQRTYRAAVLGAARIAGAYLPSVGMAFHVAILLILLAGGREVAAGQMPVGELVQFVLMAGFVLGPVEGLGGLYNESLVAGAAAERIFLLLDTASEVADRPGAVNPGRLQGDVVFDRVSFAYGDGKPDRWQLQDVSFSIRPGRTLALVGHTGAGKTSILNLLARFYEPQQGRILLDGQEIRSLQLDALHRQMGIVLQGSFLFAGTVLENLRFVKSDLTAEEARGGFEALDCLHVLDGLADGLETDVGERGANLSEGERQIVCFVRAFLADPTILILDEATSAVDTRTEALLLRALRRLAAGQTTLIIAHRLSTIRSADEILVLEHGRVIERGTHAALMAKGGAYGRLYAEYARKGTL